jgi:hypothetical protein
MKATCAAEVASHSSHHSHGLFGCYCGRTLANVDTFFGPAALVFSTVQLAAAQEQLDAAGQALGAGVQLLLQLCK